MDSVFRVAGQAACASCVSAFFLSSRSGSSGSLSCSRVASSVSLTKHFSGSESGYRIRLSRFESCSKTLCDFQMFLNLSVPQMPVK